MSSSDNNNYGAVTNENESKTLRHRFDVAEPGVSLQNSKLKLPLCCHSKESDGFRWIVCSMFIFAFVVTVALVIAIASEPAPEVHFADVVTSDSSVCSKVGKHVLALGGNAIDSAISTTICLSLVEPHITGLGGGGFILLHQHRKNKSVVIDFRETAPINARNDRYMQNPSIATLGEDSIGVPGFIKGLEYAWKKYGSKHIGLRCCSWKELVTLAVEEAKKGIEIPTHFEEAIHTKIKNPLELQMNPYIKELTMTVGAKKFNDIKIYQQLLKTMKTIAKEGSDTLYNGGSVGRQLVKDLNGALTLDDLASYEVNETTPIMTMVGKHEVMVTPLPSGGPELIGYLNALEYLNKTKRFLDFSVTSDYLHNIANIMTNLEDFYLRLGDHTDPSTSDSLNYLTKKENAPRWVSERKSDGLGSDPNYALSPPVAANVAVMDKEDNYVGVVTSLNTWFGSKVMTSNGILLNNAMANFAIPNEDGDLQTSNQIEKGKRPLSPNMVALTMDTKNICGQRLITGGASPGSIGQVLSMTLLINQDLRTSVSSARLEVQNSTIKYEYDDTQGSFSQKVLEEFKRQDGAEPQHLPYTTVNAVIKEGDNPFSVDDFRSGGNIQS